VAADYTDKQIKNSRDFAIDFATKVMFHELGHMYVHEFALPVPDKGEDAADTFSVLSLLGMQTEAADYALKNAAAGYFLQAEQHGQAADIGDSDVMEVHGLDVQRAFYLVCLMVGEDPTFYADTAKVYGVDTEDIVLDMQRGTARVRGPSTKEEKKLWDLIQGRKADFEEELRDLYAMRDDPDVPQDIVLQEIERTKKVLAIIDTANRRWA
jgi:Putative metallopeptidase